MDLAAKITHIRKTNRLTQNEFADKLFVTRQAVSRWENGETTPTIDTLKTIAELFKVDANAFFGTESPVCQSCSMPLQRIDDMGKNADNTANTEYCTHCFDDGKFTHNRTLEEMVESNLKFLDEFNAQNGSTYTPDEARSVLKTHLATLKRWINA
jgi:transcriptional regulator with XRE-family HTH domain